MIASRRTTERHIGLLYSAFRRRRYRTMHEFACQEIILATGVYEGRRFSTARQPFMKLWFDAVDSGVWSEVVVTGPSQSGKSLCGFVIPLCYYLFELGETVIAAVPDDDLVRDKWERDIEPIVSRTRYRHLMPSRGPGSKGGRTAAMRFKNGAMLRWMTAGGSDKSRAGFTSRIICMTETDGFDVRTSTSEESNKIAQIEARARSFPLSQQRIFKECTLTTSEGHTWQRYQAGTCSEVHVCCPHCKKWCMPMREHLHGWQDAATDAEAMDTASFSCPLCGELWTEPDRRKANAECRLVHRGQGVDNSGKIVGPVPNTRCFGFRWSAVHNLLVPASNVGVDEWKASRAVDEDDEERKMCQFVWAVPYIRKDLEDVPLAPETIEQRQTGLGRGQIPDDTLAITIGIDVNKSVLHWTAIAWRPNSGHIVDYGTQGVKSQDISFRSAIAQAVSSLAGKIGDGWTDPKYTRCYIDIRWHPADVMAAIRALNDSRWRGFMGLGHGHWRQQTYSHPNRHGRNDVWLGAACYERVVDVHRAPVMFADANYWKTWLHQRLSLEFQEETNEPREGGISLFASMDSHAHRNFAKHLTAEKEVISFERGRGSVKTWEAIRSANHWLDSTYIACVAGHRCGFEPLRPTTQQSAAHVAAPEPSGSGEVAPTFHANEDGFTAPIF